MQRDISRNIRPNDEKVPAGRPHGGIGIRKSTVSRVFRDLGFLIIDSDLLARKVVEPRDWPRTTVMAKFWMDGEGVVQLTCD